MPVCIGATYQQFKVTECQTNKHMSPGGCDIQLLTLTVCRLNGVHCILLYMRYVLHCRIRVTLTGEQILNKLINLHFITS